MRNYFDDLHKQILKMFSPLECHRLNILHNIGNIEEKNHKYDYFIKWISYLKAHLKKLIYSELLIKDKKYKNNLKELEHMHTCIEYLEGYVQEMVKCESDNKRKYIHALCDLWNIHHDTLVGTYPTWASFSESPYSDEVAIVEDKKCWD